MFRTHRSFDPYRMSTSRLAWIAGNTYKILDTAINSALAADVTAMLVTLE